MSTTTETTLAVAQTYHLWLDKRGAKSTIHNMYIFHSAPAVQSLCKLPASMIQEFPDFLLPSSDSPNSVTEPNPSVMGQRRGISSSLAMEEAVRSSENGLRDFECQHRDRPKDFFRRETRSTQLGDVIAKPEIDMTKAKVQAQDPENLSSNDLEVKVKKLILRSTLT